MTAKLIIKGQLPMNPLGSLPADNSGPWSLNGLDLLKIGRMGLVFGASLFVDYGVQTLTGFDWKWNGTDYRVPALAVTGMIVEALRRFVMNSGVQVPTTGSVKTDTAEAIKMLVDEAVRESMAEAAKPPPTPEELARAQEIAALEGQLAALKGKS